MSRPQIVLSMNVSLLILGGLVVLLPDRAGHDSESLAAEALLSDEATRPLREQSDDPARPPADAGTDEAPDCEELRATIERLRARLVALERELENGARDPVQRGFDLLGSFDPRLRRRGIQTLEEIARHDPEAREAIRESLDDIDPAVRIEAADALTDLEDIAAIPRLRGLLCDPVPSVRGATIEALVRLNAKEESAAIAELLLDVNAEVRADAASALGDLRSSVGVDLLIAALGDEDAEVRDQALEAIGKMRATAALPALSTLCSASGRARSFRLLETMRQPGDPEPYRREIARLSQVAPNDPDDEARYDAIRTVARHARASVPDVFRRALGDRSERVRRAAERAMR